MNEEKCQIENCDGVVSVEYGRYGHCTCHISPPCGSCTTGYASCSECDFEDEYKA